MATAKQISESLQAWDAVGELSFSDARFMQAESELIKVVKSALLEIPGVDDVSFERGSAGSIYFDLWSDASDDHTISIKVRVSNHQAGKRACENAANFVAGATLQEIELQLAKASQAMASEIAFILDE